MWRIVEENSCLCEVEEGCNLPEASRNHSEMEQKYFIKGSTLRSLNKPALNDAVGDFRYEDGRR